MQELDDLRFLRPLHLVLFFMLEIVFHHLPKVDKRFTGHELGRKCLVDRRKHSRFDLVQGHRVIRLFPSKLGHRKIRRKLHLRAARFSRLHADDLLAKSRQKIFGRKMQPEFLAAVQILARIRRNVLNRFPINRAVKIDYREIPISNPRSGTLTKSADCSRKRSNARSTSSFATFIEGSRTGIFLYSGNSNSGAVTTVARKRIDLSLPNLTSSRFVNETTRSFSCSIAS